MPFGPIVPDRDLAPAMSPGHHECAESVLIIDVHAIFLHTGLAVSGGSSPGRQLSAGIGITNSHRVQRFGGTKIWYGH